MIEAASADAAVLLAELHATAFERPWSASEIASILRNSTAFALVARAQRAQGFILAWSAGGDAEILTLAVDPHFRRAGVGVALVTSAGVAALARGAERMHLEVAEDNIAARALYSKLGYEEVGRRPAYYSGARVADAIVMRRTLPRPLV